MSQVEKCPECGKTVGAGTPGGLCPACLLKRGLEEDTADFRSGTSPFPGRAKAFGNWKPIDANELAGKFPELEGVRLIGRGGMGAVYWAKQKSLNREVALKVLPREVGESEAFKARFEREAQAMARLNHPHIVTIYEFGQRDGLYYFLMEYVDGLSLRGLLDSGHVSTREALAIVPEICDALQYAHERGIVHRDIKPENILLNKAGRVKIADFGLAKLVGEPGAGEPAAGERAMGTPEYMAPEQMERPDVVDHRADIYALGVVFYQMLTGELPGAKPLLESAVRKVVIDVRLDAVVLKALEREPERRYQQVSEIKTQVETYVLTKASEPEIAVGGTGWFSGRGLRGLGWVGAFNMLIFGLFLMFPMIFTSKGSWVVFCFLAGLVGLVILIAAMWVEGVLAMRGAAEKPRVSKLAVAGALWTLWVFVLLVAMAFWQPLRPGIEGGMRGWQGMTLKTVALGLGLTAPLVATVLGWMALRRISRSEGRVYGVPAALVAALLFPIMLMNGLIGLGWMWLVYALDVSSRLAGLMRVSPSAVNVQVWVLAAAVMVGLWALVDYGMVCWGWRIAGRLQGKRRPGIASAYALVFWAGFMGMAFIGLIDRSAPTRVTVEGGGDLVMLAGRPELLSRASTDEVIAAGWAQPNSPWAWNELKKHKLTKEQAAKVMDGLGPWMKKEIKAGDDVPPMTWLNDLLEELYKNGLVSDEQAIEFRKVLAGSVTHEEGGIRFREGKKQRVVSVRVASPWYDRLFGYTLMGEFVSASVDGQAITMRSGNRHWKSTQFYGELVLPELAPGKHVLTLEFLSALAPVADLVGVSEMAPSADWPKTAYRWKRSCQINVTVYSKDAEIVAMTQDPALDPVKVGKLRMKQVVVQSRGKKAQLVVQFEWGDKMAVPMSVDVAVRIGGRDLKCGSLWYTPSGGNPGEVSVPIDVLDAGVTTADVILTPNVRLVDEVEKINRVWGGVVEFKGVAVKRMDLK